ncbi:MAG TPA: tyrosine-type recombinase/integrase [Vicinamibacterales bacterium]|nr:tyrosine-type recombinase/integrase [Vicinamibacterales bacterium]
MRLNLTQTAIKKLPAVDADVYDTECDGLVFRTRASGKHAWRVNLGRGKWLTLGGGEVPPARARDLARAARVDKASGGDPIAEKKRKGASSLADFMTNQYEPWAVAHLRTGEQTCERVRKSFPDLLSKPMGEIASFTIERWRAKRHRDGITASTTNRDLDTLRAVLTKAVAWGALSASPMGAVKRAKLDTIGRLRFLSQSEEKALRAALEAREQHRRKGRASFNAWRAERGYPAIPDFPGVYTDHMQPIVLLALNTGLRRGELLGLTWGDVDRVGAQLVVRGTEAKSGRTRYLPLNSEALAVLAAWRPADAKADAFVFAGIEGEQMQSLKTAWGKISKAAKLEGFTFHDLRHTFASKLVQAGVDLNTVRELLGHADIKMTLRYAHLAPEHKAAAVARLIS